MNVDFSIKSGSPEKQRVACVVVGVFEGKKLSLSAELLDRLSQGFISDLLKRGDMDGRLGSTLMLHMVPQLLCDRVLLVGLGKERDFKAKAYREAVRAMTLALNDAPFAEAVCYLTEIPVKRLGIRGVVQEAVIGVLDANYRFHNFKTQESKPRLWKKLTLAVMRRSDLPEGELGLRDGMAIGRGMTWARDLGNTPANIATPSFIAQAASDMAAQRANIEAQILNPEQIAELGMHSFLSVAKGSDQPARLIVLQYFGAATKDAAPIALVGKGVSFDSGGISLKPGEGMDEMKYDMLGAASVLGAFQAAADMALPLNIVAIVPTCENMPSGRANKPGDIVTSMSGKTIEILNTDAEGRLLLCDALTYAARFKPSTVIDVATLTGACVIALGHHLTGLFSKQEHLVREILTAGEDSGDRAWHLPLDEAYTKQLKSPFADLANIGGRPAGAVTAASFLAEFAEDYDWAHLDIAGTAWTSGKDKGATGRPVPLLARFLMQRAEVLEAKTRRADDEVIGAD